MDKIIDIIVKVNKLTDRFIDKVIDIYWACHRFVRDNFFVPVWYRYFGHKHHIIRTGLKPSPWHEIDTRMLYGIMSLVKECVENDLDRWSKEDRENEIKRVQDEAIEAGEGCEKYYDDMIKALKSQWKDEDSIVDIYNWWKNYANREKEIQEALHEWHNYVMSLQSDKDSAIEFLNMLRRSDLPEEVRKKEEELNEKLHNMEMKLANEEQEMLRKAIDLRYRMWS